MLVGERQPAQPICEPFKHVHCLHVFSQLLDQCSLHHFWPAQPSQHTLSFPGVARVQSYPNMRVSMYDFTIYGPCQPRWGSSQHSSASTWSFPIQHGRGQKRPNPAQPSAATQPSQLSLAQRLSCVSDQHSSEGFSRECLFHYGGA